ncbi:MAG: hypothetical protein ACYS6I_03235, partial [Planctomycetota bacterium]
MATHDFSILNSSIKPDNSNDVYPAPLDTLMTLTNTKEDIGYFMGFPTGADVLMSGRFVVPQTYVDTPVLVIQGILDGTPANVLAFTFQQLSRADSESVDTAYEAEDTASNSTWTGYADEDQYTETITITPAAAYVAGDTVYWSFG